MKTSRTLLFHRVEHKYFVNRTTATALERDIRSFMKPDSYTEASGGYLVRSIYFDTHNYMAYHDKISGLPIRHKLRMRVYGDQPQNSPFIRLEIKSRYINVIHKIIVDVPRQHHRDILFALQNYRLPAQSFLNTRDVSKEFFRIQRLYNMKPQILVQYRRRAYEKNEFNRVRLNFDYELVASRHLDLLSPLQGARSLLKYGNAIFEIKVDGIMPFWLHQLIAKYDLQNEAISKFCYSIQNQAHFSAIAREMD